MVTTAKRRSVVALFKSRGHSERRACALAGLHRTTCRYKAKRVDDEMLVGRLRELASERPRFGYRRLHALLRREGRDVNRKAVYRIDGRQLFLQVSANYSCRWSPGSSFSRVVVVHAM